MARQVRIEFPGAMHHLLARARGPGTVWEGAPDDPRNTLNLALSMPFNYVRNGNLSAFTAASELMPTAASTQRILVKAGSGLERVAFSLGDSSIDFEAEPLFESIGRGDAFDADSGKTWYVLTPPIALGEPNV